MKCSLKRLWEAKIKWVVKIKHLTIANITRKQNMLRRIEKYNATSIYFEEIIKNNVKMRTSPSNTVTHFRWTLTVKINFCDETIKSLCNH